jgi:predicted transcriptional regulator
MPPAGTADTRRPPGTGDKPIVIRISDDLHAEIKERAVAEERSMAQVMRRALRQYLDTGRS